MEIKNLLSQDLDHILKQTRPLWENLRGKQILITGGTGFLGTWLLESFKWINDKLDLNSKAVVLSRNPSHFKNKCPHLASCGSIEFITGDVRNFEYPDGCFDYIIHGATDASARLNDENPLLIFETIVDGTKRTLDFAKRNEIKKYLFISSGAIYGKQPPNVRWVPENYSGGPTSNDSKSSYGEGKRAGELLCSIYNDKHDTPVSIARCFAFVGPYLNLNIHYAIGNFIRDGLAGNKIIIKGDGTPFRSYLYVADLTIWLWTILFNGENGQAYNVGSDREISIKELAHFVASMFEPRPGIEILKKPDPKIPPPRYVPSIEKAKRDLHLNVWIDLDSAIKQTIVWNESTEHYKQF